MRHHRLHAERDAVHPAAHQRCRHLVGDVVGVRFHRHLGVDGDRQRIENGEQPVDGLVDNDQGAPAYVETGGWSTSLSSGYQSSTYRFANTNPTTETATATWSIPVLEDGLYPVFAWFRASANRTPEAVYRVAHGGGVDIVDDDDRDSPKPTTRTRRRRDDEEEEERECERIASRGLSSTRVVDIVVIVVNTINK